VKTKNELPDKTIININLINIFADVFYMHSVYLFIRFVLEPVYILFHQVTMFYSKITFEYEFRIAIRI